MEKKMVVVELARSRGIIGAVAAALLALAGSAAAREASTSPPSFLLVTVDTQRADSLGAYGALETRTPHIDRFAETATVFDQAACPMPLTKPSHFSILTSRYPREHGVLNNAINLPESETTVVELLAKRGYRTGGFVSVTLLGPGSGAEQGFETFVGPSETRSVTAAVVVPQALEWLDTVGAQERFFLWVHLFDPHQPYDPPDAYRSHLDPRMATEVPSVDWRVLRKVAYENNGEIPAAILEHAKALYRGEVEYTDSWIGTLLDGLARRGRDRDTMVVLTADHGECFEGGVFFEHADCLLDGAIRVPLIVRWPGVLEAGRVSRQVSLVDIAPTILAAADVPADAHLSGTPLHEPGRDRSDVLLQSPLFQPRAARGRRERRQTIHTVAGVPTRPLAPGRDRVGVQGGGWKLVRDGEEVRLFRVFPGPEKPMSVASTPPDVVQALTASLEKDLERYPLRIIDEGEINEELVEALKALGYVE